MAIEAGVSWREDSNWRRQLLEERSAANLAAVRVVLVEPTHPGNVGSSARAMKTMGLGDLRVVGGCGIDDEAARANAANARDVLASARHHASLTDALAGAGLVMGLTARSRRRSAPPMAVREAAGVVTAEAARHPVALVFGREHAGLTNDELGHCHHAVHIPANPDYPAMNLAAAVQIVCYEVFASVGASAEAGAAAETAGAEHLEGFYRHLAEVVEQVGYESAPGMPRLMRRLRRLFNRARPEPAELNILRGILVAVQRHTKDADESL
ncbi:TrmJ/YjtD family RNA methyltransferase [Ectothiorhodospiraceae bacterium WFHF3C12]|nr:TrmJ/YjtD family RNA methyltransferase [Ectothiorhodospiraceae bacterium WFHF3C12]